MPWQSASWRPWRWLSAWSNCIIFAVLIYRRRGGQGYFLIRRSHYGRFPHVMYAERTHIVHYVPLDPHARACPPPLFMGRVCWGGEGLAMGGGLLCQWTSSALRCPTAGADA